MAFINSKDTIFDFVLTDKGRELLSQNQLFFKYFAFGDEGIDYKSALSASASCGISVDDYLHRNFTFEADARSQAESGFTASLANESQNKTYYRDLNSFLYTVQSDMKTLPQTQTSADPSLKINIYRKYATPDIGVDQFISLTGSDFDGYIKQTNYIYKANVTKVIHRLSIEKQDAQKRISDYVKYQREGNATSNFNAKIKSVEFLFNGSRNPISFLTKNNNILSNPKNGYLIEVFSSGSNGVLTKLNKDNVVDIDTGETISEGFSSDINVEVDK